MGREQLDKFFADQLSQWPQACDNNRALKGVQMKYFDLRGLRVTVQHNPARIISSAAKLDKASLQKRACFLCRENRPKEQFFVPFEGRKGKKYDILVNPFPIFNHHFVVAASKHCDQSIWRRYVDMLDLAKVYQGYTFFYNGPTCGASAPDHMHFQASLAGQMPLENDVDLLLSQCADCQGNEVLRYLTSVQDANLYYYERFARGIFVLRARTSKSMAKLFYRLLDCAPIPQGQSEPQFNLVTYHKDGEFRSVVIFRTSHRSHHYYSEGDDHLTMSPGCADVAGLFIVPVAADYGKISAKLLLDMMDEVTLPQESVDDMIWKLTRTQPLLSVGILASKTIEFEMISDGAGRQKATYREGKIDYNGALYDELFFDAQTPSKMFAEPTFILYDVVIGIGFHWERRETQKFAGSLKIIVENNHLVAVNLVGVEDYLLSVISSEMKASASEEFLKAHAVISRSWVMAQIQNRKHRSHADVPEGMDSTKAVVTWLECCGKASENVSADYVKWYDHDEHRLFDVCADDHCQRYQGLTRALGDTVRRVVDATWGQVLMYDGEICDARFSKCCGGVMELFSTCWDDSDKPYLQSLPDTPGHDPDAEPYCLTEDVEALSQVMNGYDLENYKVKGWQETCSVEDLSAMIEEKSGRHIGILQSLEPLEKGPSGRIKRLFVAGTEGCFAVGKELEIRKILSKSHLKSSDFNAEFRDGEVTLTGKGWGHGVGLCQVGAAVMAWKGHGYKEILAHYYPGAEICK